MDTSLHHPKNDETRPEGQASPQISRWLALGAVAGPVLLTLAWIILGAARPDYSPIRQQISDLGLGATAPFMNASFILTGFLLLAGVVGIQRRMLADVGRVRRSFCVVLLALNPLGAVLVGVFTEDALAGHLTGAILAFLTPIVGFLVTGLALRRSPGGRAIGNWLIFLASPLTFVVVVLFFQTGAPGSPLATLGLGGLSERIMVEEIEAWYLVLGALAFRRT